jgi:hypothetical protein
MPKRKPVTLAAAVERWVAGLRVNGAVGVQAALALQLAESFEQAPPYARARLAAELRALLAEVEEAEELAEDLGEIGPRLLRQVADAG